MAVTLVQSPQQRTTASPITFVNTTPIKNNILVFVGFGGGSYTALTIPAGWNSLVPDFRSTSSNSLFSQAIWRVADGTEGTSISFAYVTATAASAGILLEFSGAVSTTPTIATSSSAVLGTAETFPATIPANANALAVEIGGNVAGAGTVSTPAGYTAIPTLTQTTYVPHAFTLANPATGTDCSQPATIGASTAWISYLLLMQPSISNTSTSVTMSTASNFNESIARSSMLASRLENDYLSFAIAPSLGFISLLLPSGPGLPTETMSATASTPIHTIVNVTQSDVVTYSDTMSRNEFVSRSSLDTLSFADTLLRSLTINRMQSDSLMSFSDTIARASIYTRLAADTATFADTIARAAMSAARSQSDTLTTFTDYLTSGHRVFITLADAFAFNDLSVRATQTLRNNTDVLSFVDAPARSVLQQRAINEALLTYSETTSIGKFILKLLALSMNDASTFADLLVFVLGRGILIEPQIVNRVRTSSFTVTAPSVTATSPSSNDTSGQG